MPFELIVQTPFTERLPDNRVRIRKAGEHIFDPAEIDAVKAGYGTSVVQVWVDQPTEAPKAPEPEPASDDKPKAAVTDVAEAKSPAPASATIAKPADPAPAADPAPEPVAPTATAPATPEAPAADTPAAH